MHLYNYEDCVQTGGEISLFQKVVVYSGNKLAELSQGQHFLCIEKDRAECQERQATVELVNLSNGEWCHGQREDILGTLKPELLPVEAKLHLSQICFHEGEEWKRKEPLFSGYSFLPDGRYTAGVWLYSLQEMKNYVDLQKPYQYRVLICDRNDFAVMEIVEGQVLFPAPEDGEAFLQGQEGNGIKLK